MINLHDQMNMLMKKRTIFHSEADFQFALAWEIQKAYPDANVRLEYCPSKYPNMHLDMLVKIGGMGFPIELKYKTKKYEVKIRITNSTKDLKEGMFGKITIKK